MHNGHRGRRGQQIILWTVLVFVAGQMLGGYLLDYHWPELRFPSVGRTLDNIRKHRRSPDIICLGSSRFGGAFVQSEIRDYLTHQTGARRVQVFNASIEAGDLITADYVFERILAEGVRPKIAVIEISPETLAERNEWLGQHVLRQFTWEDTPTYFSDICRSGNSLRWLSARLLPLRAHRREICRVAAEGIERTLTETLYSKRQKKPRIKSPETQGVPWEIFLEMSGSLPLDVRTSAGLPAVQRWLKDYRVGGTAAAALDRLLTRCRQEQITPILVGVPLSSPHRELYSDAIEQAFSSFVVTLVEKHQCRFVDFRDRVPDNMFLDNHHVLRSGGSHFSRLLASEVLLPAWQEREPTITLRERPSKKRSSRIVVSLDSDP